MPLLLEQPHHIPGIHQVHRLAFRTPSNPEPTEAALVDKLRGAGAHTLSLIEAEADQVIGHILFTPITVTTPTRTFTGLGLAPLAVLPEYQKQGVGTRLSIDALSRLKEMGHDLVVVLGSPAYYPRFGFLRASEHGIFWNHPGHEHAFFALSLRARNLDTFAGIVQYHPAFEER